MGSATGTRTKTKLKCPKCGQREMARIARRGILRERVYPLLGMYPWQCPICGEELLLRRRGAKIRARAKEERSDTAVESAHQH